ncbi:MAG: hypothetical protein IV100_14880 [Myxococcales bacterium]|nr:hypothetical protein [Myxococcales bacterium]
MFFAKMAVGGISGALLSAYCPETGQRQPQLMWAIIGATTLISPILIVRCRRIIERDKCAAA